MSTHKEIQKSMEKVSENLLSAPASCQNNQSKQVARMLFGICWCIDPFKLIIS